MGASTSKIKGSINPWGKQNKQKQKPTHNKTIKK